MGDITLSGTDITVVNNTTIDIPITVVSVDTAGENKLNNTGSPNGQDLDGSEAITRLVVDGLPQGVTVVGGHYAGDVYNSATEAFSARWLVDIADISQTNSAGHEYTLQLIVDGDSNTFNPKSGGSTVSIRVFNQDQSAAEQSAVTTVTLFKADAFNDTDSTFGVPLDIDDITGFIEKPGFQSTEDVVFRLSDAISVNLTSPTGATDTFSITIKDLTHGTLTSTSGGTELNSQTINGEPVYVLTGTGGQAAVESLLASVTLVPEKNFNSNNANTDKLAFNITLTTYAPGGIQETMSVNFAKQPIPVTDKVTTSETISYLDEKGATATEALEDGTVQIAINLSTVDDPDYDFVQDADGGAVSTVTITHTSGIYGTLSYVDDSAVTQSTTFSVGNTSVDVPFNKLGVLTFKPAAQRGWRRQT